MEIGDAGYDARFATAYRGARRQAVEAAVGRLQRAAAGAVDALEASLGESVPPAVRIRAATVILDQAIRAIEIMDLAERVTAIEQTQKR